MKKPLKKRKAKKLPLLIAQLLLSATALAVDPKAPPPPELGRITEMRIRQEAEENGVTRVVQQPVMLQTQQVCTPVEQARQRIRNLDESNEGVTVSVEGTFGDVTVDNSSGTTVNQVVQPIMPGINNEKSCL